MKTARTLKQRLPLVHDHALASEWEILEGRNGRGHIVLVHRPTGRRATAASTASDHRAEKNTVSWMKKIERGVTR